MGPPHGPVVPALPVAFAETLEEGFSPDFLRHICEADDLSSVVRLEVQADSATQNVESIGAHLPSLKQLRLADSSILSVRDLGTSLQRLEILWMSRCGLQDLSGVGALPMLREFYLPFNDVADLAPLGHHEQLEVLDIEGNAVSAFEEVAVLQTLPRLHELTLSGNPMCREKDFTREAVIQLLPSLEVLDDDAATEDTVGCASSAAGGGAAPLLQGSSAWGLGLDPSGLGGDELDSDCDSPSAAAVAAAEIVPLNPTHPLLAQGLAESTSEPRRTEMFATEPDELDLVVERLKHAHPRVHQHAFTARAAYGGASGSSMSFNFPDRRQTRTADGSSELRPGTAGGALLRIDDAFQGSAEAASDLTRGSSSALAGNPLMAVRQRRSLNQSAGQQSSREAMDIRELLRRYQTYTQPSCLPPEELRTRKMEADSRRPCTPDVRIRELQRPGTSGSNGLQRPGSSGGSNGYGGYARAGTAGGSRRGSRSLRDAPGGGLPPMPSMKTSAGETLILEDVSTVPEMLE